jgi:hypothetical protein
MQLRNQGGPPARSDPCVDLIAGKRCHA